MKGLCSSTCYFLFHGHKEVIFRNNLPPPRTPPPQKKCMLPGPLGWLASSGESALGLIHAGCYASLDACENVRKNPYQITGRHGSRLHHGGFINL